MESSGFKQNTADPCVYIQIADTITVVAVYVDDLIVITKTPGNDENKRNPGNTTQDERHGTSLLLSWN